jgi:hypothetical protein
VFKKTNQSLVLKYIKSFQAINNRIKIEKNFYQYEKVCLLIVDFSKTPIMIYNSQEALIEAGLIPKDAVIDIESLSWENFIPSLLATYATRFDS